MFDITFEPVISYIITKHKLLFKSTHRLNVRWAKHHVLVMKELKVPFIKEKNKQPLILFQKLFMYVIFLW